MTLADGSMVSGKFSKDNLGGIAIINKGWTYKGEVQDGLRHGLGLLTFSDEGKFTSYEGGFSQGKQDGWGLLTTRLGKSRVGTWKEGKLVNWVSTDQQQSAKEDMQSKLVPVRESVKTLE